MRATGVALTVVGLDAAVVAVVVTRWAAIPSVCLRCAHKRASPPTFTSVVKVPLLRASTLYPLQGCSFGCQIIKDSANFRLGL